MATKIVLIGAGSAVFTRGLTADLIMTGAPWAIALVDVDREALDTALGLARRMVAHRDAEVTVTGTTDRREALPGADYVVSTIGVGGRRAWEQDVFIPRKYGVFQPVGDTIMPGGISRALRQIPATLAVMRDLAALAPTARFFNYANPMAAICRALERSGCEAVGLCHGVPDSERAIAALLGVPLRRCSFTAVGLNHLTFFTRILVDGRDASELLRKAVEQNDEPGEKLRRALFLETGHYSALHDRHLAEFFPQLHRDGVHPGGRLGVDLFSFEGTIEGGDRGYFEMREQAVGSKPLDTRAFERQAGEHEQLVEIIQALSGSTPRRFSMNVPNRGQVGNLPQGWVLECPCTASARGIEPEEVGDIPPFIRAQLMKHLAVVDLAVDAAIEHSKRTFVEALLLDGSVRTLHDCRAMADELWSANEEALAEIDAAL